MSESFRSGTDTNTAIKTYRDSLYSDKKIASMAAQIGIANVIKAFAGIFSREQINNAIGNAKSPNAVSRAVRHRLPRI